MATGEFGDPRQKDVARQTHPIEVWRGLSRTDHSDLAELNDALGSYT